MKAVRSDAPEAYVTVRIDNLQRQIRLLRILRDKANLEAAAHCQLARIAASQSDIRANPCPDGGGATKRQDRSGGGGN